MSGPARTTEEERGLFKRTCEMYPDKVGPFAWQDLGLAILSDLEALESKLAAMKAAKLNGDAAVMRVTEAIEKHGDRALSDFAWNVLNDPTTDYRDAIASARQAAAEECAKLICESCRKGYPISPNKHGNTYLHQKGISGTSLLPIWDGCKASVIRAHFSLPVAPADEEVKDA